MEEKKHAESEAFNNTRDLVKYLNANDIPREDIVDILDIKGQLLLIFYK